MTTNLASPPTTGIELSGLTKSFRSPEGPVHAVRGIDISIAPGETVALLGPNGAGKSTTIDMLLGLLPPDSGSVTLFGMTSAQAISVGAVGAMLQLGAPIQDLTVRELITMMASLYPKPLAVDEVIELTNLGDIAKRKTTKLSGGQTQRLRFAIGLVSNPDLLVLDEPTAAMDVEARRDFWATMREFAARGKTVIFATHYLEEADAYADRIILMAHGKVVADGPATEIKGDGRPADDPRNAAGRGLGQRRRVAELVVRAVEVVRLARGCPPQPVDDLDLLGEAVEALAHIRERHALGAVLGREPTGTDAEFDPPAAHRIDLRDRDRERAGSRNVAGLTSVPSRTRDVSRARPASVSHASVGPGTPSPPIAR